MCLVHYDQFLTSGRQQGYITWRFSSKDSLTSPSISRTSLQKILRKWSSLLLEPRLALTLTFVSEIVAIVSRMLLTDYVSLLRLLSDPYRRHQRAQASVIRLHTITGQVRLATKYLPTVACVQAVISNHSNAGFLNVFRVQYRIYYYVRLL